MTTNNENNSIKFYFLLSLRRTHKNDEWFSFWRPLSSGYAWFQHLTGLYSQETAEKNNDENAIMVCSDLISDKWQEIEYGGKKVKILPNNDEIRKLLGINKSQLICKHKST